MNRPVPYINKRIKLREEERIRQHHLDHLRQMRPQTTNFDEMGPTINNRKKQLIMETRFTEIERENRILLQKITGIMSTKNRSYRKRGNSTFLNGKQTPKSLNVTFRKKQYQEIEIENAKLLKRLQEKKSQYEVGKMRKDWRKQRYVIRNISNYPVMQAERKKRQRSQAGLGRRQQSDHHSAQQLTKIMNINNNLFSINVRFDESRLTITAVSKNKQIEPKLIEIPRDEAITFLKEQCDGRLQNLFPLLYFDEDTLFLVGKADNIQIQVSQQKVNEEDSNLQRIKGNQPLQHEKEREAEREAEIEVEMENQTKNDQQEEYASDHENQVPQAYQEQQIGQPIQQVEVSQNVHKPTMEPVVENSLEADSQRIHNS